MRLSTQFTASLFFFWCCFAISPSIQAQCPITVDAGDDIYLCSPPTPTQLNGEITGDYLNFSWSPLAGLTGASTLHPNVNVTQTTTYILTAKAVDESINNIANGDFEGGNGAFSSNYVYSPGNLWPEGVYEVLNDPSASHPNFAACGDHTSGSGQMMAINGNAVPNQNVWCQTISVQPNTEYAFSAWVTSLVGSSPAQLQFSVNGVNLGNIFSVSPALCNWQRFYAIWNSGPNSSASICVVNQNTAVSGNDFALDDISFSPICVVRDTVVVRVVSVTAVAAPNTVFIPCEGANVNISGAGSSTGPNYTYAWDSPGGNIVSGATTLNPVVNAAGAYTLTVTYDNGLVECTKTATVNVVQTPNQIAAWVTPTQPLGCGGNSLTLIANSSQSNVVYEWSTLNGNIVSGQMQKNCLINQAGTYDVTVTSLVTGCTAEASITVTAATNPPVSIATASGPINCIQNTATLSGSGSSTGGNIGYQWNAILGGNITAGQNTLTATVNAPGIYTFSVTNNINNCVTVDTVTVTSNTVLPVLAFAPPDSFTCTLDTVILSANGTPANLSYQWTTNTGTFSGPTQTPHTSVTAAGQYFLTATNLVNGCANTDTILVFSNTAPPVALIAPHDSITCQQNTVSLAGTGSSNGAVFSYNWSGIGIVSGGNTLTPVVNAAGDYVLVVTNQVNHCTNSATTHVFADANAIAAVANAPDTLDCTTASLVLNTNGSSTGPNFTYLWSTTTGQISIGAGTPSPTVIAPGTYQLLLTNPSNGCTSTDQVEVQQNIAIPVVSIAAPDTLTCADPTIAIQGNNNSGPGNFSYQWTTVTGNILSGAQALTPQVNAPGIYTLLTTNTTNGCTATISTDVPQEAGLPVVGILPPAPLVCTAPTVQINAGGSSNGMSILWTASNGGTLVSGTNTLTPTVNTAGTYTLLLTNINNGCTATNAVDVIDNQAFPPAQAGVDGLVTCASPQFTMTANAGSPGGLNFLWQTNNGTISGNPASPTISTTVSGDYIVIVTDPSNGCTARDTLHIAADQVAPPVTTAAPAQLTCVVTALPINLNNTAATYTYNWQTANGSILSGAQTSTPTVDAPGLYDVHIVNLTNGCITDLSVNVAEDIIAPQVQIATPNILNCLTQTLNLQSVTNGNQLQWSTLTGHFTGGSLTQSAVSVDAPGAYTLTAWNTINGCTTTSSITVQQDIVPPAVNAGQNDTLDCQFPTIALVGTASAGANIAWTASSGQVASGAGTLTPTIDHAATYTITATNPINGCTAIDQVIVVNDANAPVATIANPATLTCILQQTTLQGQGTQGNNITYNWQASNGGNILGGGNSLTPLIDNPGNYLLTVNNLNNGCTVTATITVPENITPPVVNAGAAKTITCQTATPSLLANTGAGTSVVWSTGNGLIVSGQNSLSPVISLPGTYTITATNPANGCTATSTAQVTIDTVSPTLSIAPPAVLTCATLQTSLTGNVLQPGAGNYSLVWSTTNGNIAAGGQTLNPQADKPGTYTLQITNTINGCKSSAQMTLNQDIVPPTALAAPAPAITCIQSQPTLNGAGSSPGTYTWSGPQIVSGTNTLSPVVAASGPYTLLVTAASNGCTSSATTIVQNDQIAPVVSLANTGLLTCITNTVPVSATVQLPAAPGYSINWNTTTGHFASGQTTLTPTVDAPGMYFLTITNTANGCTTALQTTVNQDNTPPVINAGPDGLIHCQQPEAQLAAIGSSTLVYQWQADNTGNIVQGGNTANPSVDAPGTYTLLVTNPVNGCTASDKTVVQEIPLPEFTYELTQPNCHQPTGTVDITAITGTATPYTISIDGGLSFSTNKQRDQLKPGNYELIVKDGYGCTASADATLDPPFFPTAALPNRYIIEQGDSVQFTPSTSPPPSAIAIWSWSPDGTLDCGYCETPYAAPYATTQYVLTVTDVNGCTAVARTTVEVDQRRHIYAPNVFTPDEPGDNNRFMIFGRGIVEIEVLQVFDRWGAKVWQGTNLAPNDVSAGWDGKIRDKGSSPAVFVWQAVIVFPDGKKEVYSGDVTIVR